ncbi:hypothetical protein ARD30_03285 [Bosea thiooxidans]|uniref:Lipoprotein n=1 Tax=Bosea thiooxidans TaxID=53254 RepID=A0A0Q3I8W2_9HYPH|nr:hypothetical protein [Bosea thiooxidans]KQK31439.1 hypothetical protein ARD30_03285 [Bosea thiooxidans]SKB79889.1 hypothetical protein SAMN05660750_02422 [Bosea thiooxidans]
MIRTTLVVGGLAILMAGCVSQGRPPVPQAAAGKQIMRDGAQLALPDGTRVTPDSTGGFLLPNGDYVKRDRSGALVLPTGARCAPNAGGYVCP